MASHILSAKGLSDEWYTPRYVIDALGPFDLDPSSPEKRPHDTARIHLTINDNGLCRAWRGRVWLNPPYSNAAEWIERLAKHGNGIALIPARVETEMFHAWVWNKAHALLFTMGRIRFIDSAGHRSAPNFPPVFIAYGAGNAERLKTCGIKGKLINLKG